MSSEVERREAGGDVLRRRRLDARATLVQDDLSEGGGRMDREQEAEIRRMVRGEIPRYRRKGECTRCGACCTFEDPPCEHFTPATETEPATCAIWNDPDRDLMCIEWPTNPPIKISTCGYRFDDLVDGRELDLHEV